MEGVRPWSCTALLLWHREATNIIAVHREALQLRTLQTIAEISIEKNSTKFPAQFMTTVQDAFKLIRDNGTK